MSKKLRKIEIGTHVWIDYAFHSKNGRSGFVETRQAGAYVVRIDDELHTVARRHLRVCHS